MSKLSLNHKDRTELIFVSGPIGVGKTTFSHNLLFLLSLRGYNACYKSFVSFPLFSYLFFKLAAILVYGLKIVKMHEEVNIHPSTLFKLRVRKFPRLLVLTLIFLEVLSVTLYFCIKILLSCMNKKVVIVDEGIINILASYLEIFGKNVFLASFIVMFMKKFQRWLNLKIIYLDVKDEKVLLKRWIERGYPAATSIIKMEHHLKYTRLIRCAKALISKIFQVIEIESAEKSPYKLVNELVEGCTQCCRQRP